MYILPGYTKFYEEDGAIFLTSKLWQNTVKLTDPTIQEEFRSIVRCGGCLELSSSLTQFLHDQELLADEMEIRQTLEKVKHLLDDILLLTIMPTEGCNFRCPYCYETHTPVSMTRQMLNHLQTYIAEQAPKFKQVHIGWFGGEPTLCKDTILETSSIIQALQSKHNFKYTAGMTTNGYLLNIDYFHQFFSSGITCYQITLDGWNHDKTRPHVSGKGTLQTILNNLAAISALPQDKYPFNIILRHNILAGDEDFSWYDHLYEMFGKDSRFSVLVRPVSDWGGESVHSLTIATSNEWKNLMLKHTKYLDQIGMQKEDDTNKLFSQICYASYPHSMVFRANGKIEKCTIALDHPKNLVGYIDSKNGVVLNPEMNQLWTSSALKKECHRCPDVLSCINMQCKKSIVIDGQHESQCTNIVPDNA